MNVRNSARAPIRMSAALVTLFALSLIPRPSRAQGATMPAFPAPRWGLAAAVGGGLGTGSLSCASCAEGGGAGAAGFGRIGGAYRSNLIVAAQVDWWTSTKRAGFQDVERTLWSTNAVVQWFPSTTRRWFVTSGLGLGFADIWSSAVQDGGNTNAHGVSYQFGGGYEVPLGVHLALVPYGSYFATPGSRVTSSQERLNASVLQLGVGLGWR